MTRYIDADALMLDIVEAGQASGRYKIGDFWELNGAEIRTVVDAQPTIDAVPVRHGRWIEVEDSNIRCICSACGWESHLYEDDVYGMPYCPKCGARRDKK